jgi:protocatechuate 3,4-dioxygenase beta subunit
MGRFDSRRRVIGYLGAAALAPLVPTPALGEGRAPTPRMTEGPFYPRIFPDDSDADLTRVAGRAGRAQGTPLEVSGRVVDRSGRAVAGARVEIWQCDALGRYHHVGEPESAVDPHFQGFGAVTADADGRYRFQTIRPVPYSGRAPHIHFTVARGERRVLTSQMFIEGDAGNERDGLYRHLGREARLVTMRLAQSGAALQGQLDIVLA